MPFQPYFFNDTPTVVEQITKNTYVNEQQSADIAALRNDVDTTLADLDKNIKSTVLKKLNEWNEDGSLRSLLNTKKIMIVGDSYTAGQGISPGLSFPELMNAQLATFGWSVDRLASAGGGFVAAGTYGTFYNLVNNWNGDGESYTDVLFLGGVNDSYSNGLSTLVNVIAQTCATARQKFPNAKIHIGYISQLRRSTDTLGGNPLNVKATIQLYKSASLDGLASYITNSETMLKSAAFMQSDGVHPSVDGHRAIANYLISYLVNGNLSTTQMQTITDQPGSGGVVIDIYSPYFHSGGWRGSVIQTNDITELTVLNAPAWQGTTNIPAMDFDGLSSLQLGTWDSCLLFGQSENLYNFGSAQATIAGTVTYQPTDSEGTPKGDAITVACPLILRLVGSRIYVCPIILRDAGHYAHGTVRQINTGPFTAIFSSIDI